MATKAAEKQHGAVTAQQAREALTAEKKRQEQACLDMINLALADFNCRLDVVEVRRNGRLVSTSFEVVFNEG